MNRIASRSLFQVCTRLVTLPYIRDRCCVTMSIVCPEFMTPESGVTEKTIDDNNEGEISIKMISNNNAESNIDGEPDKIITVDNSGVTDNNNNNNNINKNGYSIRSLLGDTIENLARLVADMIKHPSSRK